TGGLLPFTTRQPVRLPAGAPRSGGPRPQPADEDELDWEDETTLEQMVVNGPEAPVRAERDEELASPRGISPLEALRRAVAGLDDALEDEDLEEELEDGAAEPPAPPPRRPAPAPAPAEDQLFTREEEAA